MSAAPTAAAEAGRPSVLSLNIRERGALYASYIPQLKTGGIFIPTSKAYRLGDEVFLLISLPGDPIKLPVAGRVVWLTPEQAQGKKAQGIGVQFNADDAGQVARRKIEAALAGMLQSPKPTHTL